MAPRKYTKLMKPVFARSRQGHISTSFLDDYLLIGIDELECIRSIQSTLTFFRKLDFVNHPDKSMLKLSHKILYLGVFLDSEIMIVTQTPERAKRLK